MTTLLRGVNATLAGLCAIAAISSAWQGVWWVVVLNLIGLAASLARLDRQRRRTVTTTPWTTEGDER